MLYGILRASMAAASGHHIYDHLVAKGYPDHLKDSNYTKKYYLSFLVKCFSWSLAEKHEKILCLPDAENIVNQCLPRKQNQQYSRQLEDFETGPPSLSVPHYEDDPYWTSNRDQESAREIPGDMNYHSFSNNKRGAPAGRGKKLKKPEPPLVLSGIPRLDHSFVMAKKNDEVQNKDGILSDQDKTSSCSPEPFEKSKIKLSRNNAFRSFPPCSSKDLSSPEEKQMFNDRKLTTTIVEDQNTEASTSDNCDSKRDLELNQQSCSPSQGGKDQSLCDLERKKNEERRADPTSEIPLKDPIELEKETKKYYEELLGVKDTDDEISSDNNAPENASISASQVASITKKFDSLETEKAKEEEQQKEIQTAWSILHQYWEFVRENPYDFNGWTYLLTHVENMDNLEAARSAFEGFLPLYPYCFAYWKKLSDMEVKHKELERSLGVLLMGTQCIPLCTDLWMPLLDRYISYAKKKELSPDNVRQLYEYGLLKIGHAWHSSCFWEGSISYELHNGNLVGVMSLYKRLLATPTKLYNKHWDHFLALVRDHHPCNLLSPEDYEALRKQTCEELKIKYTPTRYLPSKSVKKTPQPEDKLSSRMKEKLVASYIKTHESNEEQVDKRWKFEERIKRPYFHIKPLDKKQIKNWKEYLDFEISEGNPLRIIPLFERCLVACALYEEFWCRYTSYLERHVQNIIDGKYRDSFKGEDLSSSIDEKDAGAPVNENEVSEASTNENIPLSNDDGQVNSENVVDIKNVENTDDSEMRGSGEDTDCDSVAIVDHENSVQLSNSDSVCEQNLSADNSETVSFASGESNNKDEQESVAKSEPPTIEQIKSELCANLSLEERVLKCAPLTPDWIMTGVSWEDVRQIYRRGAWIHCPNKPSLLMQWAEFEEIQGNLDTARELLNTAIAKYPTLFKCRMQLIELERRAGCNERVEELYGDASRALTLPRQRSWLAIKYARFLFKVLMEADRALAVLRKALKKDRGYVHLYHHVFDICYQRQPLDCQGVLASVLLALTSKELPVEDKYWFAYKRVQFLREHGDIQTLKAAIKEQDDLREESGLNLVKESAKKSKEVKKEEEKKPDNEDKDDEKDKTESLVVESSTTMEATAAPETFTVPNSFSADGAITYSPMEGYGYGHADPNQNLPTAQEVVQGVPQPSSEANGKEYHSVPPSWELKILQIGSYGV
ncbi:LOW QUALITY PROTEIN: pre-mRNA-processing factor 39-like [Macrobrachium nipponense]|uniref:LOW QUALITY PROTEIN: pre-mRNA-processing factor 39-like n=1 Tax=Macrobrachium nipponense TaxID=159736 RepID=UPI0030C89B4F